MNSSMLCLAPAKHVIGRDAFLFSDDSEKTKLADLHRLFHPVVGVARDQDLSRPGVGFEPLGGVDFVADHRVVGSSLGANVAGNDDPCIDSDAHVEAHFRKLYESDTR